MFFHKNKKQNFNIVLCVNTAVLADALRKTISDNPESNQINFKILEEFHFGRQCINYIRKNINFVDLVIIDADLDEFDGYEVCRELRERYEYIPLLLISKEKNKLIQAKQMYNIDEILLHPYQPSYLWTRINNIVNKSLKQEE